MLKIFNISLLFTCIDEPVIPIFYKTVLSQAESQIHMEHLFAEITFLNSQPHDIFAYLLQSLHIQSVCVPLSPHTEKRDICVHLHHSFRSSE